MPKQPSNQTVANRLIQRFEPQIAAFLQQIRRLERHLGPDDDWIEDDRRLFYEAADMFLRPLGRPAIAKKGRADYVTTAAASPDEVEVALTEEGYQRNLLSTRKYREHHDGGSLATSDDVATSSPSRTAGRQWAVGSYVLEMAGDRQHHVYLFPAWSGGTGGSSSREGPTVRERTLATDVYAHREASASEDPYGHVTEPQTHGDPDGFARIALDNANIIYNSQQR